MVIAADRGYSEGLKGLVVRGMNGHVGRDEGGGEVHPAASLSHAAGFDVAPGEKERSEKEKQKSACGKNGEEKSADADADADADERESRGRSVLLKSNVSRCCAAGELDACTSSSASASRGIDSVGSINAGVARLLQLRRMVPLCSTHASELCALVKSLMATGAREQLRELGLAAPPPLRAPVPTLTSMQPRMLVRYIESVLAHLEYNYTGVSYFNIRKDRPLSQIMDTAKQILREQLPIKCVEAVFLSLYLTSWHRGIARIPVAFRTRVVGAKASSSGSNGPAPEYRHLVLILHNRQTNRFGALGTSRRRDLACKDFTYTSIGELLTEFRRSYARWMHRVVSITLGLPVQHLSQQHSSQSAASGAGERMPASTSAMAAMGTQFREHFPRSPVCWRYCRLDVSDSEDVDDNDGAGSTDDMMVMEGEEEEEAEEHEGGGGVDKTARGTSRAISGVTDVMNPAVDGEKHTRHDGNESIYSSAPVAERATEEGDTIGISYDEDHWQRLCAGAEKFVVVDSHRLLSKWAQTAMLAGSGQTTAAAAAASVARTGMREVMVIDRNGERRYGERERRDSGTGGGGVIDKRNGAASGGWVGNGGGDNYTSKPSTASAGARRRRSLGSLYAQPRCSSSKSARAANTRAGSQTSSARRRSSKSSHSTRCRGTDAGGELSPATAAATVAAVQPPPPPSCLSV